MERKTIQWHPGFQSALRVELEDDEAYLQYEKEHNLTSKPLQIDILIKKEENHEIRKSIGKIFRKYNIIEYKSPDDSVNVNVFCKVMAYANLYQSDTERIDEIRPDEITITIVCSHYPKKLLKYLKMQYETEVKQISQGIYYLTRLMFPVQIVLVPQLSREEYFWMSRLRSGLKLKEDIEPLAVAYKNKEQYPLYQSVMDLIVRANENEYREAQEMCDALMELFADKLDARERQGMQQGMQKGVLLKRIEKTRKKFDKGLSAAEAADCLEEDENVMETLYCLFRQNPDSDDEGIWEILTSSKK